MRTFIAVPVTPSRELKQLLRRLDLMGRAIKPVQSDQMHITLKFLGEIAEQRVMEVAQAIDAACTGIAATSITLQGLGVFPDRRRPAVIWSGIAEAASLVALENAISSQLASLGYPREQRAYHPHLTLARVKAQPPDEFFDLLDEHAVESEGGNAIWGECEMDRVVLYQSQLSRGGTRYVPLATTALQKD